MKHMEIGTQNKDIILREKALLETARLEKADRLAKSHAVIKALDGIIFESETKVSLSNQKNVYDGFVFVNTDAAVYYDAGRRGEGRKGVRDTNLRDFHAEQ